MKKILLSLCLMLTALVVSAGAQFHTSESARKAGERMGRGDRAGALAVLDQAIEQRKDLHEAYAMRAHLRASMGDLDGAIADYGEAIKITPNDVDLYDQRAMFRLFKRDSAGALQDYDAAIAHGLKTEKVYARRAMIKQDTGDIEGAIMDYRTAVAINPKFISAHAGLASALERKGEPDAAITYLQDFLTRYEEERDGKLPSVKGATSTGVRTSVKREGVEKDGKQVYLEGGQTKMTFKGNTPEEIRNEMAKHEQRMNLAVAYMNLGRMYASKNDFGKALENYDKSFKISPDTPYLYQMRGEARIKLGDLQGAIADLSAAINFDTGAANIHHTKGLLLTLQGNDAEAEKEFALHLQTFPTAQANVNKTVEEAKKLRSQQTKP
ncbi:MAG TPA: tetratricopeptide repeat protein [Pyrinomonadaceae bacterium]|nr:tetratricopeptide repeat protein [Pyrinomonadaceae bacterium]